MMNQDFPQDESEEFDSTFSILQAFSQACRGNSSAYTKEMLIKLLNYSRKVPFNGCQSELAETDAVHFLFLLARHQNPEFALLAFGIMLNITAMSKRKYDPLNTKEFFDFLITFFDGNCQENILALVLSCLANFVDDSLENRNLVLERFPIPELKEQFNATTNKYIKQEITHLIYSISKYELDEESINEVIEFCIRILKEQIESCYTYSLWTLVMILRNNESIISGFDSNEFITLLDKEILSYEDRHDITNAALVLLYLFIDSGKEIPRINLFNITNCLTSSHDSTQNQALNVLKQFIIKLPDSIPDLLNSGFFSNITTLLESDAKYITKLEAAHVFCYMVTQGDQAVSERLCITGGVSELIAFFGYDDDEVTLHSLEALYELFRCASLFEGRMYRQMLSRFKTLGGFDFLDEFEGNENPEIAEEATSIKSEFITFDIDDIPYENLDDQDEDFDEDNEEDSEDSK